MAELINLNKARKLKARAEKAATAAQNRVVYGMPTALRKAERLRAQQESLRLDGLRRDDSGKQT
jgi:hypothetical protein